jgi:hypothetical protein
MYEELNQIAPNLVAPTHPMHTQTNPYIAQLSYLNKKENRENLQLTDIFFFLNIFHCTNSLQKH